MKSPVTRVCSFTVSSIVRPFRSAVLPPGRLLAARLTADRLRIWVCFRLQNENGARPAGEPAQGRTWYFSSYWTLTFLLAMLLGVPLPFFAMVPADFTCAMF
jgi:hypothetical protein